jgi:hypothetical protein
MGKKAMDKAVVEEIRKYKQKEKEKKCRNPNLRLVTKARVYKGVGQD